MPIVDGLSHWTPDSAEQPPLHDELTTGGLLDEAAARWPQQEAVVYSAYGAQGANVRWTYSELRDAARDAARALLASGLTKGDRVAIWSTNIIEWLQLQFGAAYAGVVLVPLNPLYRTDEVAYVLERASARAIFVLPEDRGTNLIEMAAAAAAGVPDVELVVALGTASAELGVSWADWLTRGRTIDDATLSAAGLAVSPDDLAQIQFTSGTTGAPKGAMLRHGATVNNARLFAHRAQLRENGRFCSGMPFFHCGGSVLSTLGAIATGSTLMPLITFDPRKAIETIDGEQATFLGAVWAMQLAIEEELDRGGGSLMSLETCANGGSLVPPEIPRRWRDRFGVSTTITYGLTEASPVISQTSPTDPLELQVETVGQPLAHVEVAIADPATGEIVPTGTAGEVRTRGWLVMQGYFGDEDATRQAITGDGWLCSGDLGTMDDRGYLRITGRTKDMIIRGGENIYPAEIEAALRAFDEVADAHVVGVPDARYGEVSTAFVRLVDGSELTHAEMKTRLTGRLARYKIPAHLRVVEQFPLTPSGKVQKFKLREQFVAAHK